MNVWRSSFERERERSLITVLSRNAKVKDLIDLDTSSWYKGLIYQMFSQEEAYVICGLPISYLDARDKLVWQP